MREYYECTNQSCGHVTEVRVWPATRVDPMDSTWGDGCEGCGAELEDAPLPLQEMIYDPDRERDREVELAASGWE